MQQKNIKTINNLIDALNSCALDKSESCYLDAMKRMDINMREWEKFFSWRDDRPSRVCLYNNDEYEIFLSCWEKGQIGKIHDIDSEEAWIHPIYGEFTEERFRILKSKKGLEKVSSVILSTESYSYMQKTDAIYRYINSYEARSVCLHLYSKPITNWKIYDLKTGETQLEQHPCDLVVEEVF